MLYKYLPYLQLTSGVGLPNTMHSNSIFSPSINVAVFGSFTYGFTVKI